ncbi:MAG: pyruvate carboxylase [Verrucomicrobiales bacterium]|jgi:pyruvate carboxylase
MPANMSIKPIRKLLVANRSEIATRVFRAASELDLCTVAIYANEDRFSIHRFKADESYQLNKDKGPVGAYLDIEGIVTIAVEKGVDAIHPGYGFLAENGDFARACEKAGIIFIGPRPEILELMGDKVAARAAAQKAGLPTLQGTEEPVSDRAEALKAAQEIGFPLIIKAAFGGGGRGMRVVKNPEKLDELLTDAQNEAKRAFGNDAVFLERFISRAKHIEVQVLGDRHGNAMHLHERDCSVQRRHQKVVEIAPSVDLDEGLRHALCDAAVNLVKGIGYDNAGTVEFLVDIDTNEWFFIEMNPRIQVEHTVTEEITNTDIVRSQILIAQGYALSDPELTLPAQEDVPRNGFAVQCRITTEDPEQDFRPDIGQIITYRSAAGLGVRLDSGLGTTGSVVTPYYDSLLVKVTTRAPTFEIALQRMNRALREFRIRGVKTNIPFVENVIANESFRAGKATTTLIDTTPELFRFRAKRDRATKLLKYLGNVIVNGNPHAKGHRLEAPLGEAPAVPYKRGQAPPAGTRQRLLELGPEAFSKWILDQKPLLITDTTFRDAHQSLFATRVRTYDMMAVASAVAQRTPNLFSLEMWGGATFDSALRFLHEDPWDRLAQLRKAIPNICFQMLFRGSNAVGYSNYPDNVVAGFVKEASAAGMDIFRIFDSLNYLPNLKAAMEAVHDTPSLCEGTICYTGDILDPDRDKYSLKYYVELAKELVQMGAHLLCIKDMAGLCRPYAANKLVKTLKEEVDVPIHFHTHDTSGINAASILQASDAGVDIADAAIASFSGGTSQPNLNSIVAALQHTDRDTELDLDTLNEYSDYWEHVRKFYVPFDTSPPHGSAEVYLHEMPGGQFTNLKEQANSMGIGHKWPEIARTYAEVNHLFGDIVKVTPSSKVVGDLTMFLITRGIKAEDVSNLPPGTPFPESVIDMLAGGLGQPMGGWPAEVQKVILGDRPSTTERPGKLAPPVDLKEVTGKVQLILGHEPTTLEVYSYLMYPQVFEDYVTFFRAHNDVSVLPSPAFFYGLCQGEEIVVHIQEGKTLFIKFLHLTDPVDGIRTLVFELNGVARHVKVKDASIISEKDVRPKADEKDESHVGAPMPGLVSSLAVSVGSKVSEGDALLTLEAMKMFTTITAPKSGTVGELNVDSGDTVENGDLLIVLT